MATSKKLAEQIAAAESEIKEKEKKLLELKQKHKAQEGKEQTHRLIERGKILESLIENAAALTDGQIQAFLEKTITTDFAVKILSQLKQQNVETTSEKSETERETAEE